MTSFSPHQAPNLTAPLRGSNPEVKKTQKGSRPAGATGLTVQLQAERCVVGRTNSIRADITSRRLWASIPISESVDLTTTPRSHVTSHGKAPKNLRRRPAPMQSGHPAANPQRGRAVPRISLSPPKKRFHLRVDDGLQEQTTFGSAPRADVGMAPP